MMLEKNFLEYFFHNFLFVDSQPNMKKVEKSTKTLKYIEFFNDKTHKKPKLNFSIIYLLIHKTGRSPIGKHLTRGKRQKKEEQ